MNDQTDMNRGFLKEKLGNYQVDPPEKVWDEISEKVGGGRNRKGMFLVLLVSAASLALVITLGIHFLGPDMPQLNSQLEQQPMEQEGAYEENEGAVSRQPEVSNLERKVAETMAALPEGSALPSEDGVQIVEAGPSKEPEPVRDAQINRNPELAVNAGSSFDTEPLREAEPMEDAEPLTVTDIPTDSVKTADSIFKLLPDAAGDPLADPLPFVEQDKKRDPRWMLGAAISPLYSFRDAQSGVVADNPDESGTISYSTGVQVSYRRNSRFAIETGIYFNKTGIAIGAPGIQISSQRKDDMLFNTGSEQADIKTVSNSVGNIIAYSGDIYMNGYKINAENSFDVLASAPLTDVQAAESGIQQHLDYLELPFNIRYSVIDRAFELQLVGGMSTNFLVNNYVTMETASGQEEIGYLSNINTVNYSGNAGVGMIYHMGGKLSLSLEPRFRYFLNSINDSSLPSTRPYSLGLYTGLSYTF